MPPRNAFVINRNGAVLSSYGEYFSAGIVATCTRSAVVDKASTAPTSVASSAIIIIIPTIGDGGRGETSVKRGMREGAGIVGVVSPRDLIDAEEHFRCSMTDRRTTECARRQSMDGDVKQNG